MSTFHRVYQFKQSLVFGRKIKLFRWWTFFLCCSYFSNKLKLYKIEHTLSPIFCISVTIGLIWTKFLCTKTILFMTFFLYLVHVFQTQSLFSNFEQYFEILNLLYLNQMPIDFLKTYRFQCRIKKKIIEWKTFFFDFILDFFDQMSFYYVLKFLLSTYNVIFHSPKEASKNWF